MKLQLPEEPPSGATYSTHRNPSTAFLMVSWLAVLLVGVFNRVAQYANNNNNQYWHTCAHHGGQTPPTDYIPVVA